MKNLSKVIYQIGLFLFFIFVNVTDAQSNIKLKNHTFSSGGAIVSDSLSNYKYNVLAGQTATEPFIGNQYQGSSGIIPGINTISSIDDSDKDLIIKEFILYQNYPNPFNPVTTIRYQIPKTTQVSINVYNVLGQKVKELVSKNQTAGIYEVNWDGRNISGIELASGMYFFHMHADEFVNIKKMIYMK